MPNIVSQAVAGPSSYHPHNHQLLHFHQHLAQQGIVRPLLVEQLFTYTTQSVIEEGFGYLVDVVFVKDPLNFFCQFVSSLPHLYALMGRLSTVYSGKETKSISCKY